MALAGQPSGALAAAGTLHTGFTQPFRGARPYVPLAPPKAAASAPLHQAIGQQRADRIAHRLGLTREDAFTPRQYRLFVRGGGVDGSKRAARILDRSVKIFVNTVGHPLYADVAGRRTPTVLGSYGLFVTHAGLLESLANQHAPTRKANAYIQPGGYLGNWCRHNHATRTLQALYASGYTVEAAYGFKSQQESGTAQLVTNTLDGRHTRVGMSMVPSIWMVNFALLWVLRPSLAAEMPSAWAPIPRRVAHAIEASPTGQVRYAAYRSLLH